MIVDDEPLEREVLKRMINEENLAISHLYEAKNGAEAVDLAKLNRMDIVLMDIKMPIMNGLEATEIIKNDVPNCRIIFLTAYEESDLPNRTIKLQADDYLLKPAHQNEIKQILTKYIPLVKSPTLGSLVKTCEHNDVLTVLEYIENNLHLELNLDTLSGLVYLNGQYLSRLFKQETGCTITHYITARRLEKAKQHLSYSRENVMEISEKCGFSDSNYFARVFKKYEGVTPTQFQQKSLMSRKKRINSFNNFMM
jgi:YesN/AraC family two-component response regulator